MVCDKLVCDNVVIGQSCVCVTKLYVCVCDKVVCERQRVTKLCLTDGR